MVKYLSSLKKYFPTLIVSLILFGLFLALALWVGNKPNNSFDQNVLENINSFSNPVLDRLMVAVSFFGEVYVAVVLSVILCAWLLFQNHRSGLVLVMLAFGIFLAADFFKVLVERPRPELFLVVGYSRPESFGFPSGHVSFYSIYFGFILFLALVLPGLKRWLRILLVTISLLLIWLIGFSRMYLGVHWPTDVIGGYLLGFSLLLPFLVFYIVLERVKLK